jgi:hypothetical protein
MVPRRRHAPVGGIVGKVSFVVRQRVTHPRHRERFEKFMSDQAAALKVEIKELEAIRRYHFEKEELFFYTFYDFRPEAKWRPELQRRTERIREAWREFGPDMREFTAVPYEEIWRKDVEGAGDGAGRRPITIERLVIAPAQEKAWNEWAENELLPDQLSRLPLTGVRRYRALTGEPTYYLQTHEYRDAESMHESIAKAEKPGTTFGATSPSKFWAGWAKFMPYVDDLTRWIILPVATS